MNFKATKIRIGYSNTELKPTFYLLNWNSETLCQLKVVGMVRWNAGNAGIYLFKKEKDKPELIKQKHCRFHDSTMCRAQNSCMLLHFLEWLDSDYEIW